MIKHKWHSGPPPHVGWWNASLTKNIRFFRWWDGKYWSEVADPAVDDLDLISIIANQKSIFGTKDIFWNDYWPENARVPRIPPDDISSEKSLAFEYANDTVNERLK